MPDYNRSMPLALIASFAAAAALALAALPARAQSALDRPPPMARESTAPQTAAAQVDEATAAEAPASATKAAPETRIEQRRQGNRIVEVTVTPAGSTRSYVIVNREGQRPTSPQDLSSGLSTPRFFRLDF